MTRIEVSESRHGWFRLWIGLGFSLAVLLLVNSISNYRAVSRRVQVERLRRDLATQVVAVDQQVQRSSSGQVGSVLEQYIQSSNRRIVWIEIRDGNGSVVAHAGRRGDATFPPDLVRAKLRERQPVFKTVETDEGTLVVEAFPFRLPGGFTPALFRRAADGPPGQPRRFGVLEIAASLNGAGGSLWPLQRSLIINVSAALVLVVALALIALRFRSYVEGRQLEAQLEIARHVQRNLLPSVDHVTDGFELAAECLPATRVGGDFYDTVAMPDNRAAFVLGDVSGKGIPAALLMGVIHGAVRTSTWTDSRWHHEEATSQLNRLLLERASDDRFASMFWAYYDPQLQLLRYINAGHFPPLLFKASQPDTPIRLSEGGPVLGLLGNARYVQGVQPLDAGDVLVLYSDGIVEAANAEGEPFSEERLVAVIRTYLDRPADEIRNQVLASVRAYAGRTAAEDDQTLMVIRRTVAATRATEVACEAAGKAA